MGKLVFSLNVTPDGFCGHTATVVDEELMEYFNDFMRSIDIALFGRVTYQLMEDYWPDVARERTGPKSGVEFADLINDVDKIVLSRTLKSTDWQKTIIVPEMTREWFLDLKQQPGKTISVGGIVVANQVMQWGLIDEYYFLIHPIIVGGGKRMFETDQLAKPLNLELMDSRTFKSGVTALHYKAK